MSRIIITTIGSLGDLHPKIASQRVAAHAALVPVALGKPNCLCVTRCPKGIPQA